MSGKDYMRRIVVCEAQVRCDGATVNQGGTKDKTRTVCRLCSRELARRANVKNEPPRLRGERVR